MAEKDKNKDEKQEITSEEVKQMEMQLAVDRIKFQAAQYSQMVDMVNSIPSFAEDADESKWHILTEGSEKEGGYTEQDIKDMQERAQELYYIEPSAYGLVETMVDFVVGKDAVITPVDIDEKVRDYWKDFGKASKFNRKMKELVRRTFRDGECFVRFFPTKRGSKAVPKMRFIEPSQITSTKHTFGIQTNAEDVEDVKFYHRKYHIRNAEKTEKIPASQILHIKIRVDSNVKRGISLLVGVAKYIIKYRSWLDDRIMLNKIRTMFNIIMKVSGISLSAMAKKFEDVTVLKPGVTPSKKLPRSGSVLMSTPNIEYEMKNLNIHAEDTKDDGRNIELMFAKALRMTEYVVRGDASNSNYASTMVAESPMVRMFSGWQDFFEEEIQELFERVMKEGIRSGAIPRKSNTECVINFERLITRKIKDETEAFIQQREAGWISDRTASERLGNDFEKEQKLVGEEDKKKSDDEFNNRNEEDDDGQSPPEPAN